MTKPTTVVAGQRGAISVGQLAEHEGLVHWVVRQQWLGKLPFADALHEGRIGLWHALEKYDPSRGTRISTYAVPAIARSVWRAVARQEQGAPTGDALLILSRVAADEYPDPIEPLYNAQVRGEVHRLIRGLPPRLRQIIVAHYGLDGKEPQTFGGIGQTLGLTRQRVQQLHVVALLWLAQPAHSLALRCLLGRNARTDYQQTLQRQRQVARARRSSGRTGQ